MLYITIYIVKSQGGGGGGGGKHPAKGGGGGGKHPAKGEGGVNAPLHPLNATLMG